MPRIGDTEWPSIVLVAAWAFTTACGANTALPSTARDAGAPCAVDADCDDGRSCTLDACIAGACQHRAEHAVCGDGRFCDGEERCAPTAAGADERGCVLGAPIRCDDSVSCTVDACDELQDRCVQTPDESLCQVSFRCDPILGCVPRALAHDRSNLFEIDLPSGATALRAALPVPLDDIALHPDGRLFGAATDALWLVDLRAGTARQVASVPGVFNALDFASDGTLFGAVSNRVVRIDPVRGLVRTVATFDPGFRSGGDLAFVHGKLFAAVTMFPTDPNDLLVHVDLVAGTATLLGSIGFPCVWGLAARGDVLFGLTCNGQLLRIDQRTGAGKLLADDGIAFHGAAAR